MKKVIILGSSRKDGDATLLVNQLVQKSNWDVIDLNDYNISYYDYDNRNRNDDYLDLMTKIIDEYDTLIFATPVYWYAMSGILKVFFDRITDLLTIERELGRKLRGKKMAVVSCSGGNHLGDSFWLPFSETAKYLGMEYLDNLHTISKANNEQEITTFVNRVNQAV
ncbi:MAG: FMN reductase [Bacteroidetes bacterium]|nr:MAG: FMN reductase [Bacteroidota bacterium]